MVQICEICGTENREEANFCRLCSNKLRTVCNCWVKKGPYNCGQRKCPGKNLAVMVQGGESDEQV